MFEVLEFFFYAIVNEVGRLFARHGRRNGLDYPDASEGPYQLELAQWWSRWGKPQTRTPSDDG